jgi:hypothetical protein
MNPSRFVSLGGSSRSGRESWRDGSRRRVLLHWRTASTGVIRCTRAHAPSPRVANMTVLSGEAGAYGGKMGAELIEARPGTWWIIGLSLVAFVLLAPDGNPGPFNRPTCECGPTRPYLALEDSRLLVDSIPRTWNRSGRDPVDVANAFLGTVFSLETYAGLKQAEGDR